MQTNKRIRLSMILLICALVACITLPVSAQDEATVEQAESFYQQGVADYTMKHWSEAAANFEQSFQVIPHSMTAYMLSVTYLNWGSPRQALAWARKADSAQPELEEPYATGVGRIVDWARKSLNDPYYTLSGKADEANRPSAPRFKPPRPALPQQSSLGIAPSSVTVAPPVPGNFRQPPVAGQPGTSPMLTGRWRCNDGGTYFIRQAGQALWWYGRSSDGGRTWANVFHGRIDGNRIKGQWADVPQGHSQGSGEMFLQIVDMNTLRAIRRSGGFGGNEWTR